MSPRTRHHVGGGGDRREAIFIRASQVQIRQVQFLWRPYLPLGKVTLLAGAPGQGKSQLTAFFAAHTSRDTFDPSDLKEPGQTVILTAEDDLDDTVVPRLIAAGADLERVEFINMRRTLPSGLTADGLIKLPGDIDTLHGRLKDGDVRLVVFDPVASFVGRDHSTLANQDVRDVLDPIVSLARAYTTAIVVVLHLNKSEAKTWSQKIAESHAWQAVARTVLALAPDPNDEDGEYGEDKVLAATKLNIARRNSAVKFKVRGAIVYDLEANPVETSRVDITGTMTVYADDLLAGPDQRAAYNEVREWVEDYLGDGWRKSGDMQRDAVKDGHAWRTVMRVRKELCQVQKESGVQHGPWWVALKATRARVGVASGIVGTVGDKAVNNARANTPPRARARDNGQSAADLEAYRRERDRRLGEGWDDE